MALVVGLSPANAKSTDDHPMKAKAIKYLVGFGIFLAYYIVARQLENRVSIVRKLTGGS